MKVEQDSGQVEGAVVRGGSVLFRWRERVMSDENGLSTRDVVVALVLSSWMSAAGGSCYPGIDAVAKKTRLALRTVVSAMQVLERAGYIRRELPTAAERRHGRNTRYFATLPDVAEATTSRAAAARVQVQLSATSRAAAARAEEAIEEAIKSNSKRGRALEPPLDAEVVGEGDAAAVGGSGEGEPTDLLDALARLREHGDVGEDIVGLVKASYAESAAGTLAVVEQACSSSKIKARIGWVRTTLEGGGHRDRAAVAAAPVAASRPPAVELGDGKMAEWCGECDEGTRSVRLVVSAGDAGGERYVACPCCHPSRPRWCGRDGVCDPRTRLVEEFDADDCSYSVECDICHPGATPRLKLRIAS